MGIQVRGHCHESCKQDYQRKQINFKGGAEYLPEPAAPEPEKGEA
jgi:hypothetical protein